MGYTVVRVPLRPGFQGSPNLSLRTRGRVRITTWVSSGSVTPYPTSLEGPTMAPFSVSLISPSLPWSRQKPPVQESDYTDESQNVFRALVDPRSYHCRLVIDPHVDFHTSVRYVQVVCVGRSLGGFAGGSFVTDDSLRTTEVTRRGAGSTWTETRNQSGDDYRQENEV